MVECSRRHEWDLHHANFPHYQEIRMTCKMCGAGHILALTMMLTGEIQADITVLAAKGESKVSREIIKWSLLTCEGTIQEMQQDGVVIVHGETIIPALK